MMTLIPPSLEDMGIVLFGLDWREPFPDSDDRAARALDAAFSLAQTENLSGLDR
jgi:hypothetical protein